VARQKKKPPKKKAKVSRAATPARRQAATRSSSATSRKKAARKPATVSPLPTRHVAPSRPAPLTRARSMPPTPESRKPPATIEKIPVPAPDFAEAGVILAITYSIREGRRGEFFELMRELKPILTGIGGNDCTIYEDRSRSSYFMEVFRFKDEAEFTAFDDKFHKDRKIATIYALLDDIVEAEKSDFKIFERRL
jgi:hypothetical protein